VRSFFHRTLIEPRKSKKCHDAGLLFHLNLLPSRHQRSTRVVGGRSSKLLGCSQLKSKTCCWLPARWLAASGAVRAGLTFCRQCRLVFCGVPKLCDSAFGCCTASCARIYSGGDFVLLTEGVPLPGSDCWTAGCTIACKASCIASCISVFDFFSSY